MIKEKVNIILFFTFFLFIFLLGLFKVGDYDIFYHLATGKYILETGKIYHSPDPFSFTSAKPLSTASWLAGVIFYKIENLSGIEGLIIFNAFIITLIFFVLYLNMKVIALEGEGNRYIFLLVLLVAAFTLRMRMFVRPSIFEFLLLALYFYILNLYKFKNRNYLLLLPLLQIIWVNMHGSNILGIAVPFIFLTGESFKYFLRCNPLLEKKHLSFLTLVTLLIIIASFINPIGYKIFSFPFMVTGQEVYMAHIGEWQPLTIAHLLGYGFRYTWGFSVLSLSAIVIFLYQRKKVDLTELIIFCLFFFLVIKGVRLTAEFAIAVAPIVARGLFGIFSQFSLQRIKHYEPIISGGLIVALFVIFYTSILNSKTYAFGLGLKKRVFPVEAVDFLIENDIQGNMYNSIGYGGYLIWELFPKRKVFIDGRNNVYTEEFYKDYLDAHFNPVVWKRVVNQYDIDWVILEYSRDYARKEKITHLIDNPEWALVYWDRVAVIYAKRGSKNDELIKKFEYKYARPNDLNPHYLNRYLSRKEMIEEVIRELKRNLSINPDNEESHLYLVYIYSNLGMQKEALQEMKKITGINRKIGFAH